MILADWRDRPSPVFSVSAPDAQADQLIPNSRAGASPAMPLEKGSRVLSPDQLERQELEKEYANLEKKYALLSDQIEGELNEDNKDTLRTRRESIKKKMSKIWSYLNAQ